MNPRITIDQTLCEGHALCEALAPDVFEMGDDDRAHVRDVDVTADMLPRVQEAVRACPCQAIDLRLDR
jgi:ferredoxin